MFKDLYPAEKRSLSSSEQREEKKNTLFSFPFLHENLNGEIVCGEWHT